METFPRKRASLLPYEGKSVPFVGIILLATENENGGVRGGERRRRWPPRASFWPVTAAFFVFVLFFFLNQSHREASREAGPVCLQWQQPARRWQPCLIWYSSQDSCRGHLGAARAQTRSELPAQVYSTAAVATMNTAQMAV